MDVDPPTAPVPKAHDVEPVQAPPAIIQHVSEVTPLSSLPVLDFAVHAADTPAVVQHTTEVLDPALIAERGMHMTSQLASV